MADDEEDFMLSADEDDFDFGYDSGGDDAIDQSLESDGASSEHENQSSSIPGLKKSGSITRESIENKYYRGKSHREDDKAKALQLFQEIIDTEPHSEYAVKACKQSLKLSPRRNDMMISTVRSLIQAVFNARLPPSYKESSLCGTLERLVTQCAFDPAELCQLTLSLMPEPTEMQRDIYVRLRTKLQLLFARLLLLQKATLQPAPLSDLHPWEAASALIESAQTFLSGVDSSSDGWRTGVYLEALALQMQLALAKGNNSEAEDIYHIARDIKSQLVHPRIQAVICEVGGALALRREQWDAAKERFFKCFKFYDEAGAQERLKILQYYAIASLLTESGLDPFGLQETMVYKDAPELRLAVGVVNAFNGSDTAKFQQSCDQLLHTFGFDSTVLNSTVITALRHAYARQTLLKLAKLYYSIEISRLADKVALSEPETKSLLTTLIIDGSLAEFRFDDTRNVVERSKHGPIYLPVAPLDQRESQPLHPQQSDKVSSSSSGASSSGSSQARASQLSSDVPVPKYFQRLRAATKQAKDENLILQGTSASDAPPSLTKLNIVSSHHATIQELLASYRSLDTILSSHS